MHLDQEHDELELEQVIRSRIWRLDKINALIINISSNTTLVTPYKMMISPQELGNYSTMQGL